MVDLRAVLSGAFTGSDGGHLPGTFGAQGLGLVTVLNAVVLIGFADRPQRFVIQAGQAKSLLEFLGKLVEGLEVIRSGGDLVLGSLQELLVAAVDQLRNFRANQIAWVGENFSRAALVPFDSGRNVVFLEKNP